MGGSCLCPRACLCHRPFQTARPSYSRAAPPGRVVVTSRPWAGWGLGRPSFARRTRGFHGAKFAARRPSAVPRRPSLGSPAASARRRCGYAFLRVEQQLSLRRRLGRGQAPRAACAGPFAGHGAGRQCGPPKGCGPLSGTCRGALGADPRPGRGATAAGPSPGSRGGRRPGTLRASCPLQQDCLRTKRLRGPDPG